MSNPDIYGTQIPQPGPASPHQQQHQQQNFQHQPGARFTPPPNQPMYYQPEPAAGCGTYFFRFVMVMLVIFVLGFFLLVFAAGFIGAAMQTMDPIAFQESSVSEKFIRGSSTSSHKVVIMTIEGMIMESEDGFIERQIRQILKDNNVQAVVLRVDSPGGTMSGSDYYHHLLKKIKTERDIPIVVSMGSVAASGGYYVSMVANEIYAEHSTITGSIGVIVALYDGSELFKKIGVESTPITSGPHKAMGSFSKPMSEEERALWQKLVDVNFDRFKEVIREGRKDFEEEPEKLDKLATGQIYTAKEAQENKLVDKIGYLDDAVDRAMELAGLTENNSKVVKYRAKKKFMELLLESRSPETILSPKKLSEVTTPKVYLLAPQVFPFSPAS